MRIGRKLSGCLLSIIFVMTLAVPVFAAKTGTMGVADLPPAAQMAFSEAMGRDDAAYHGDRIGNGYRLKNRELIARFDAAGASVNGWRLAIAGIGRGGELITPQPAIPEMKANRIEYRRGDVIEWYVNGPLGLEQGFTLERAPELNSGGPLTLAIDLPGAMKAEISGNGADMVLKREGFPQLGYGRLAAWDAAGKSLPAWFEIAGNGKDRALQIRVDDSAARYPVIIDPFIEQKLTASDAAEGDSFGSSVSLNSDGTTVLIGAPGKRAAYVFTRNGSIWSEQQKLTASDEAVGFGSSVSLSGDGNTALIGAYYKDLGTGAAYVFTRNVLTWSEQQKLTVSDAAGGDYFGWSVSLSGEGNTALIGAYGKDLGIGAAYVFTRSGSTWSQQQKLTASDAAVGDYFGWSVSISWDGNTALIGAHYNNSYTGAAYVFTRSGSTWSQQQKLTASDAAAEDRFGSSVSISGDVNTALIGAYSKNLARGAAYVFNRIASTWSEQQKLTASDSAASDYFGYSVSLSGDGKSAQIGAHNNNTYTGAAYPFRFALYCNGGYYTSGAVCTKCSAGTYQTPGYNWGCIPAPVGFYVPIAGASAAIPAPAGSYIAMSGASSATLCPSGEYQDATGQALCVPAPPGTYVSSPGASSASPCLPGTCQSSPGQTSCINCPVGAYQNAAGQTTCITAPAGTHVSAPGATSSTPCAAGTYQVATGSTSCTSCPANTVQPATGQSSCVEIPKAATTIVTDPSTSPATLYAGIDTAGIYRSSDGGANWIAATTQPSNKRVKALVLKPGDSTKQFAATYGGGVFKSINSGVDWSACASQPTNLNVVSLTIDTGGKLYAGTEAGVFVSADGCATWAAINGGLP